MEAKTSVHSALQIQALTWQECPIGARPTESLTERRIGRMPDERAGRMSAQAG